IDHVSNQWRVRTRKIRSDNEKDDRIHYSLEGVGASKYPFNVFIVDPITGHYNVSFLLRKIDIRIKVLDENDNPPVFAKSQQGSVKELSPAGTSVMKIIATDADEPGNVNSKIFYSLVSQRPSDDLFQVAGDGTLYVKQPFLDREKTDEYTLIVKGQDLDGKPGGNTATSTVTVKVQDVNDNLPTLEKEGYEGDIQENTQNVEVMRIKAQDLDLEATDNWEAVFDIVKGNEAGYFSISTDPVTNEGILMLDKAVNYEDVKDLQLGLIVKNKAPIYSSTDITRYKTYPIKINVKNVPEGPSFSPKIKAIPISEGETTININDVIAHYPAIDEDTGKPAENVKYAKGLDPDNWLTIDPLTAEIKLNKMPDRESPYLVNGTYIAKVLCITDDLAGKTVTGTVAIQVEDFNDHCPTLSSELKTMCTPQDHVTVTATDEDASPNGAPFDFEIIPEGTQGKWRTEHNNDTSAILRLMENMWPGLYEVEVLVQDQQGKACPDPQKVKVQVCTCEDGIRCGKLGTKGQPSKGAELGPAAIGLLFLGLLLLALIPLLLLLCQCGGAGGLPGGFAEMPFDTKSHLINYHTEGQGENTVRRRGSSLCFFTICQGSPTPGPKWATVKKSVLLIYFIQKESSHISLLLSFKDNLRFSFLSLYFNCSMFLLIQKMANGGENLAVKDNLLVYDYEGQGSTAGSVGCCSLLESENDLQFLDDLGPKFKKLAQVCQAPVIPPQMPALPQLQPSVTKKEQTVIKETSQQSQMVKERVTTERGEMVNSGQVVLLQQQQQPVYYTTTPVMQPMHYIVQPQMSNTVLLAEAPAANMQGMVLVNSGQTAPAQGMVIQGQTMMSGGQYPGHGMVLVEGGGVQALGTNLIRAGNLSGSQAMVVVEDKVPAGSVKVLKEGQTTFIRGGTLPSTSQRVMVVGGTAGSGGQLVQEVGDLSRLRDLSGSQKVLYSKGSTTMGSQSNLVGSTATVVTTKPSTRKKVVHETREVVREKRVI
uniref:Desmoglein 2 n=1 Tax=Cynoglossus semilaevis TaxID=244447 RepID=A0A3P8UN84_CYNSE